MRPEKVQDSVHQPSLALGALSLSMFVMGTASLLILGVGHEITNDLKVAPGAAGWLMTVFSGVFALALLHPHDPALRHDGADGLA